MVKPKDSCANKRSLKEPDINPVHSSSSAVYFPVSRSRRVLRQLIFFFFFVCVCVCRLVLGGVGTLQAR